MALSGSEPSLETQQQGSLHLWSEFRKKVSKSVALPLVDREDANLHEDFVVGVLGC